MVKFGGHPERPPAGIKPITVMLLGGNRAKQLNAKTSFPKRSCALKSIPSFHVRWKLFKEPHLSRHKFDFFYFTVKLLLCHNQYVCQTKTRFSSSISVSMVETINEDRKKVLAPLNRDVSIKALLTFFPSFFRFSSSCHVCTNLTVPTCSRLILHHLIITHPLPLSHSLRLDFQLSSAGFLFSNNSRK